MTGGKWAIELEGWFVFAEINVEDKAAIDHADPGMIAPDSSGRIIAMAVIAVQRRHGDKAINEDQQIVQRHHCEVVVDQIKLARASQISPAASGNVEHLGTLPHKHASNRVPEVDLAALAYVRRR